MDEYKPNTTVLGDLAELDLKFLRLMGKGAYGHVIEVESKEDGSRRALKHVRKLYYDVGEIMLWPTLEHPNLVPVEKIVTIQGRIPRNIFLMPVLECTLEEVLCPDGPFSRDPNAFLQARRWLEDTVRGLAHMHGQGLAHLDIKLNNVLVSPEGVAKVADFSFVSPASCPTTRWGAPRTVAPPEACRSFFQPVVQPRAFDAWTLGMLSVHVFLGKSATLDNNPRPQGGLWTRILGPNDEDTCRRRRGAPRWARDVYPFLKRALKPKGFAERVASAYPASHPSEKDAARARAFVGSLLRLKPERRAPLDRVLQHELFGGPYKSGPLDKEWSGSLDEARHRREISELHDRLHDEDSLVDGRCSKYVGRAPWILMDEKRNVLEIKEGLSVSKACGGPASFKSVEGALDDIPAREEEEVDDKPAPSIRVQTAMTKLETIFGVRAAASLLGIKVPSEAESYGGLAESSIEQVSEYQPQSREPDADASGTEDFETPMAVIDMESASLTPQGMTPEDDLISKPETENLSITEHFSASDVTNITIEPVCEGPIEPAATENGGVSSPVDDARPSPLLTSGSNDIPDSHDLSRTGAQRKKSRCRRIRHWAARMRNRVIRLFGCCKKPTEKANNL